MTASKIKRFLGVGSRTPHYHGGEFRDLEDISDPTTWEDETAIDWAEFVTENKWPITLFGALGVFLAVYFSYIIVDLSVGLIQNVWFQRASVLGTTAAVFYLMGHSNQRELLADLDWLMLMKDDGGVLLYLGYYRSGEATDAPLFVPVKGFRLLGHRAEPYRVNEVSAQLARQYESEADGNRDDVAVIRLHPEFAVEEETDWGRVVGQMTHTLSPDAGNESNIMAERPETVAEEDALTAMKSAIRDLQQENQDLKDDVEKYKRQYRQEKREAEQRKQDIIQKFIENHQETTKVHQRNYSTQSVDDEAEDGVAPQNNRDLSDIDAEVSADD